WATVGRIVCRGRPAGHVGSLTSDLRNAANRTSPRSEFNKVPCQRCERTCSGPNSGHSLLRCPTKAGLDYNSVWLAWGKSCPQSRSLDGSQEDKFAHCNPHKKDTQMLSDIMQILQDNPQLTDLKSRLGRLKMLSTKQETLHTNQGLEPRVYEECLYYLRTYGSYATTLSFYLNQNDIKSAVCLLLEGAVDLQVYLENLFSALLYSPAESPRCTPAWPEYLRVSCAYCERHQLFHVLYQVQVLTGDHVRAALTCIHFFRHNARNYGDLATTKGHLETAVGHLQQRPQAHQRLQLEVVVFLASATPEVTSYTLFGYRAQEPTGDAVVWTGSDSLPVHCQTTAGSSGVLWHLLLCLRSPRTHCLVTEPKNPLVMQLSGQDLTRYLSTARLQLEVVVFLASSTPEVASYTLFGSSAHRVSLAAAVIAAGDDLEQSLALATRVTEDWQQGKPAVLCPAAAQLVRAGRASVVRRLVTLFRSEPELCNELLITALKEHPQQSDIDTLMALVTGVPSKITAMIECGQLKSAYLLAVKHDRLSDIQRIMEAADQLGPTAHQENLP
ncbi:zinc finger FYVE domain-containing protein 26-like, partial [Homalodisca vitripennis]|uniref:zinc finger FYVE domain-containing protein 26-like n=1 Tax=Homalodisca vitripennis TaxID=197043 RepID=UPI001EEAC83C